MYNIIQTYILYNWDMYILYNWDIYNIIQTCILLTHIHVINIIQR